MTTILPSSGPAFPLMYKWQRWHMGECDVSLIDTRRGIYCVIVPVYYWRDGENGWYAKDAVWIVPYRRLPAVHYGPHGIDYAASFEKFYRLAPLTFSRFAASDPHIKAERP